MLMSVCENSARRDPGAHGKARRIDRLPVEIFRPAGTRRTVDWINEHHGAGHATYLELPEYSHLDTMIGRNAATEVFPAIVEHLDRSS